MKPERTTREGERRWPMAAAVLTVAALAFLLPDDFRPLPGWIFQVLLLAFLVVLIIGDPGRIDRDSRWLHITTNLMIAVITVGNTWAAPDSSAASSPTPSSRMHRSSCGRGDRLARQRHRVRALVLAPRLRRCGRPSTRRHSGHPSIRLSRVRSSGTPTASGTRSSSTTSRCPSTPRQRSARPMCRP